MPAECRGFLLKTSSSPISLAAALPGFDVEPLYPWVDEPQAFGLQGGPNLVFARFQGPAAENPWDDAYDRVQSSPEVLYAEPDIAVDLQAAAGPGVLLEAGGPCSTSQQAAAAPAGRPLWHLDDEFSQLRKARNHAAGFAAQNHVRIGILDTGYQPGHPLLPAHLLAALGRDFTDGDKPGAVEPNADRLFDNFGHGSATIALLAGQQGPLAETLGGAPNAEVIPIRVSKRVVVFTSALARGLRYAMDNGCHVVSVSMGGVASQFWADAVNAAYEAGVSIVAASGNNFGFPKSIVYPARFKRVLAACGVMSDRFPYILPFGQMSGNFGPDSKMKTALAAFTPNVVWAKRSLDAAWAGGMAAFAEDGRGTSAATPQVAAAAALWLQTHGVNFPAGWMRVENVRRALLHSALPVDGASSCFGAGTLRAFEALRIGPATAVVQTPKDDATMSFLKVLTGIGLAPEAPILRMFATEMSQLWQADAVLQRNLPDPDGTPSQKQVRHFLETVAAHPDASEHLREHARRQLAGLPGTWSPGVSTYRPTEPVPPPFRRLRVFALDPSLSRTLQTTHVNEAVIQIPWEDNLEPGPLGRYFEVIDHDPVTDCFYPPVDLNGAYVMAQDGHRPSEGNPAFHQQMVYAVACKIAEHFEHALGRPLFWRRRFVERKPDQKAVVDYVERLRIYPHAFRGANAYYSPEHCALLFGYFQSRLDGLMVFTCLSSDIIAHETTHAVIDGLHPRLLEPTNPDVHAFHEAFADIVALFHRFTITELVADEIAKTQGRLSGANLLGGLARQFGKATGVRDQLRGYCGLKPDPGAYRKVTESHARGAILVAAVFQAFLAIYERRSADLIRLATGGSGILREGAIPADLINRLTDEAAKTAKHVLELCIRGLDYLPPVDLTFGEFLRAIITADVEMVPNDRYNYRVALIESFEQWGIAPADVRTLSIDSLLWQAPAHDLKDDFADMTTVLDRYLEEEMKARRTPVQQRRLKLFEVTAEFQAAMHEYIKNKMLSGAEGKRMAEALGLDPSIVYEHRDPRFEVHALRRADRLGPDRLLRQVVLVLTQWREVVPPGLTKPIRFRGGATVVFDIENRTVKYVIRKRINSISREQRISEHVRKLSLGELGPMALATLSGGPRAVALEPFRFLHRDYGATEE